jgi:hypothetical protein
MYNVPPNIEVETTKKMLHLPPKTEKKESSKDRKRNLKLKSKIRENAKTENEEIYIILHSYRYYIVT